MVNKLEETISVADEYRPMHHCNVFTVENIDSVRTRAIPVNLNLTIDIWHFNLIFHLSKDQLMYQVMPVIHSHLNSTLVTPTNKIRIRSCSWSTENPETIAEKRLHL